MNIRVLGLFSALLSGCIAPVSIVKSADLGTRLIGCDQSSESTQFPISLNSAYEGSSSFEATQNYEISVSRIPDLSIPDSWSFGWTASPARVRINGLASGCALKFETLAFQFMALEDRLGFGSAGRFFNSDILEQYRRDLQSDVGNWEEAMQTGVYLNLDQSNFTVGSQGAFLEAIIVNGVFVAVDFRLADDTSVSLGIDGF